MAIDELKSIIGGIVETLKMVADQPEFQSARHLTIKRDETVEESFNVAIQLLDAVWEALDQEVPEGLSIQDCQNYLKKCWSKSDDLRYYRES